MKNPSRNTIDKIKSPTLHPRRHEMLAPTPAPPPAPSPGVRSSSLGVEGIGFRAYSSLGFRVFRV